MAVPGRVFGTGPAKFVAGAVKEAEDRLDVMVVTGEISVFESEMESDVELGVDAGHVHTAETEAADKTEMALAVVLEPKSVAELGLVVAELS